MSTTGAFTFVLHSHIPYARQAGMWPHGEEWIHEAIAESYVPLLNALYLFVFPVQELRIAAGSRQVIVLAGDIMTLPGLPADPNAFDIDLTPEGEVVGLL